MTVENTQNKMPPLQMGTATKYPFTFAVLLQDPTEEEALKAIKASVLQADGTEIELVYGVDYTVNLNTDRIGGTLTVNNTRTSKDYLTIYREYTHTQEVDYKDLNAAPAETFEQCFDKLTMLSQQQQEAINRSLKLNISSTTVSPTLPEPMANNTLIWDSEGAGLKNYDIIGENNAFKKQVNSSLASGLENIQNQFDELENAQDAQFKEFKAETNTAIKEFEDGIDAKIETVADAADKINTLDESIQLCKDSAEIATNKAEEAKELLDNTLTTSNITNCITSIPQRIKLDLSNGTLTLKAGSVVIIPNGFEADGTTRKFNQKTLSKDCTGTVGTGAAYLFSVAPSLYLGGANPSVCYSSDTVPDSPVNGNFWYDTKNNIVKRYQNNAWSEGWSFPICEITAGAITNIFNGIGYIGATVFVDKDVTILSANGRNENGTLNNESYTTNSVKLIDLSNWEATGYDTEGYILRVVSPSINRDLWSFQPNQRFFDNIDSAPPGSSYYAYVESENQWYTSDATSWHKANVYICAAKKLKGGYFKPKTTFRAIDFNDKAEVSSWALPSDKFTDLTLGASGSKYTAPANGWIVLRKKATAAGQYIQLVNNTASTLQSYIPSGTSYSMMCGYLPVKSGDSFTATYTADSADYTFFRFIYAQGEDY